jgi:hypothetical protein
MLVKNIISRRDAERFRCIPFTFSNDDSSSFLNNHASEIAAIDYFVVPTVTFRLL